MGIDLEQECAFISVFFRIIGREQAIWASCTHSCPLVIIENLGDGIMCKRILEEIRNLHKRLFERKSGVILRDDVSGAVFNYICHVLPTLHDKSIFRATSFEHLGKLYFDNILTAVEGGSEDIIQEVIRRMSPPDSVFFQKHDFSIIAISLVHRRKIQYMEHCIVTSLVDEFIFHMILWISIVPYSFCIGLSTHIMRKSSRQCK